MKSRTELIRARFQSKFGAFKFQPTKEAKIKVVEEPPKYPHGLRFEWFEIKATDHRVSKFWKVDPFDRPIVPKPKRTKEDESAITKIAREIYELNGWEFNEI